METQGNAAKIQFGPCCFCGAGIDESEINPCSVTVSTKGDKWQVWYCHADCFKQRIFAGGDEMDLSPAHF